MNTIWGEINKIEDFFEQTEYKSDGKNHEGFGHLNTGKWKCKICGDILEGYILGDGAYIGQKLVNEDAKKHIDLHTKLMTLACPPTCGALDPEKRYCPNCKTILTS